MNIHEYQAKDLLRPYGVAVPNGFVAYTPQEAVNAAQKLPGPVWVVKSQIHAGGRGAGRFKHDPQGKGGVRLAKSLEEVEAYAKAMLGKLLVTKQTGEAGRLVKRVYIEEGADIARELYVSLLIDRKSACPTFVVSTQGGMDIETVAEQSPEKILKIAIDPATGFSDYHARLMAFALKLGGESAKSLSRLLKGLYQAFIALDAALIEINPLIVTQGGAVIALDAKVSFDDNALFRHLDIAALRDEDEEDPAEIEAARHSLNYVKLEGNIGCMVNGAGLAMATMDIINLRGDDPTNFSDVGARPTRERVTAAFKLILADPKVEGILVNIFGGIMRCDVIAEGVVAAAREVALHVPLVVRLEGTNVELGKKILAQSGLPIIAADNLADAAEKVVGAVKGAA
jgi:succinyl-CoA synthetase beta subunit